MRLFPLLLLFIVSSASAQNKDSIYRLESLPLYDQDGNMTSYVQDFNHIPTSEDTAAFLKRGRGILTKEDKEQNKKDLENFMKEYNKENPSNYNKTQKVNANKPKKKG
jgi:hypothetical protein